MNNPLRSQPDNPREVSHVRQVNSAGPFENDQSVEDENLPVLKEHSPGPEEIASRESVQRLFGNTDLQTACYSPTFLLQEALPADYPITAAIDLLLKYFEGQKNCRQRELGHLKKIQEIRENSLPKTYEQWEDFNTACEERDKSWYSRLFHSRKKLAALQTETLRQMTEFHQLLNPLSISSYPPPDYVPIDQAMGHCRDRLEKCAKSHHETLRAAEHDLKLCLCRLKELIDQYFGEAEKISSETWELCLANEQIFVLHRKILAFIKEPEPEMADEK